MGVMVNGEWRQDWYESDEEGAFQRPRTVFHGEVSPEDIAPGRYLLYVSYACPWAHRTLIVRALRGLEEAIDVAVVNPLMGEDGWSFEPGAGVTPDPVHGARFLREVYAAARGDYTGRVTVPVLWDREAGELVNNESRDIIRLLDTVFTPVATRPTCDLAPADLREAIDAAIDDIYEPINNGVYRAGFATTQRAYEAAYEDVFAGLDRYEALLARQRFVCGDRMTEADVCLFTTLLRFDPVYYAHFKCNRKRIRDYPNLWGFVRDLYQTPGVAGTCDLDHIKRHYYWSHPMINPTRIVPVGPVLGLDEPHHRGHFSG